MCLWYVCMCLMRLVNSPTPLRSWCKNWELASFSSYFFVASPSKHEIEVHDVRRGQSTHFYFDVLSIQASLNALYDKAQPSAHWATCMLSTLFLRVLFSSDYYSIIRRPSEQLSADRQSIDTLDNKCSPNCRMSGSLQTSYSQLHLSIRHSTGKARPSQSEVKINNNKTC